MSTPESAPNTDPNTELLKSIAASLKAIHTSLESLTGSVEGVAESIEKAHEPEGDLGVHLVSSLKDLTSALHKQAKQERSVQPQQGQRQQNQQQYQQGGRRDDRNQRGRQQENRPPQQNHDHSTHSEKTEEHHQGSTEDQDGPVVSYREERTDSPFETHQEQQQSEGSAPQFEVNTQGNQNAEEKSVASPSKRPRPNARPNTQPNRRRRNNAGVKPPTNQAPVA